LFGTEKNYVIPVQDKSRPAIPGRKCSGYAWTQDKYLKIANASTRMPDNPWSIGSPKEHIDRLNAFLCISLRFWGTFFQSGGIQE
jgi:hypothetical protein